MKIGKITAELLLLLLSEVTSDKTDELDSPLLLKMILQSNTVTNLMTPTHSTGLKPAKIYTFGCWFWFFPLLLFVWAGFSFSVKSAIYTGIPISLLLLKIYIYI